MSEFPFLKNFRGLRIKRTTGELEFQEVFLDKLVADEEAAADLYGERKLEIPLSRHFLWGLYAVFVLMVIVFFTKTFQLQVFAGEEMQKRAEENAIRSQPLGSDRGVMYDRFMKQLVFNRPSFDFVCDKRDLPEDRSEKERIVRQSANILDIPFSDLKREFDKTTNPKFLLTQNLSHEQLIVLETRIEQLEGCEIQKNTIREYAASFTLSHVLGTRQERPAYQPSHDLSSQGTDRQFLDHTDSEFQYIHT